MYTGYQPCIMQVSNSPAESEGYPRRRPAYNSVHYFAPGKVRSTAMSVLYVCLSVCLSALISNKPHVQTSRNFLCTLPVTTAGSPPTTVPYITYFRFNG